MVRKEHAFTQRFRTAKGVRTRFWGGFGGHSRLWPPNQKKASLDPFHENMVRKVYMAKISGPCQLFYETLFFLWYKWGLSPLFFFLADANFPTDNPSHTDKPCLLWIWPIQITSGVCLSSNVTMIDLEKRKNEASKQVWIHFMKTWYGRFTWQKYLVRANFFMRPFFFCGINGA